MEMKWNERKTYENHSQVKKTHKKGHKIDGNWVKIKYLSVKFWVK